MLFTVYFPCYKNTADYDNEVLDCLGFIEQCINDFDCPNFVVLGHMNFECKHNSHGFKMFDPMCKELKLKHANAICANDINYTYYQDATNNNSVIDHIFVSENLVSRVTDYSVDDSTVNMSDHLPVSCSLMLDLNASDSSSVQGHKHHVGFRGGIRPI